jgi:hypothetical protein
MMLFWGRKSVEGVEGVEMGRVGEEIGLDC